MKPRRTIHTDTVFRLPGGNEDNDLWVYRISTNDGPAIASIWVPTDEERAAIAAGENIRLIIFGTGLPPVAMDLTNEPLGKRLK